MLVKVVNRALFGLNFDINGFFSIESVLYDAPPGGGIETILSLLLKGARDGELELCFKGDCLLGPDCGGLKTIFLLEAAFLIGRNGDFLVEICDDIGARSIEVTGSW